MMDTAQCASLGDVIPDAISQFGQNPEIPDRYDEPAEVQIETVDPPD